MTIEIACARGMGLFFVILGLIVINDASGRWDITKQKLSCIQAIVGIALVVIGIAGVFYKTAL
jgi:hypothetical protein